MAPTPAYIPLLTISGHESALGMDTPWPMRDVLRVLLHAAEHLLDTHVCDMHGYEEIQQVILVTQQFLTASEQPASEPRGRQRERKNHRMPYKTPEGHTRIWTYLPDATIRELRRWAIEHRRRLSQELQVAVEEYLARQRQEPKGHRREGG